MVEDSTLLRRFAREGDQSAFAELVTRHIDRVYGIALRRVGGDTHLAEDVAQTVFTTLARKAASLIAHPALSAWIHRTTHNAAIDAVRSESRRRAREEKAHAMHELHDDPVRDAEWEKLRPDLDAVMAGLPERDRVALALRFFEDRPFADIGRRLSVSEDAARMRVDRALERMRGLLARRGITCTAAALGTVLTAPGLVAAPAGLAAKFATTALASAPAGTTLSATLLHFMSSTKLVTNLAASILFLAVGAAMLETFVENSRHITYLDTRSGAAPGDELRTIEARTAAVTAETRALRDQLSAVRAVRAQAALFGSGTPFGEDTAAEAAGHVFMDRHPAVRQAVVAWTDARTRTECGALFRRLRLTPSQIEAFIALKRGGPGVSGSWSPGGERMSLRLDGPDPFTGLEAPLSALLGEAGYRTYRDYESTKFARTAAMSAASYLCFSDQPLTTVQVDELARIIHQNRRPRAGGADTYDWDRIAADASGILMPAQQPVLDALRAEDRYIASLNRAVPLGSTP